MYNTAGFKFLKYQLNCKTLSVSFQVLTLSPNQTMSSILLGGIDTRWLISDTSTTHWPHNNVAVCCVQQQSDIERLTAKLAVISEALVAWHKPQPTKRTANSSEQSSTQQLNLGHTNALSQPTNHPSIHLVIHPVRQAGSRLSIRCR